MAKPDATYADESQGSLTLAGIAGAVEGVCGRGSVGVAGGSSGFVTDDARSAFVRIALYLAVLQRTGKRFESAGEAMAQKRKATREVREELAQLLSVDANEVFRLHHHAAGMMAKDEGYREKVRTIERELAEGHGIGL